VDVDADLVFVGYGINAPEQHWNDYKGDASDYKDKILVMLVNDPPATTQEPNLFGGKALTYYGRWTYKYEEAARRGAAGAILLHTDQSAGYPWSVVRTSNGSWRFDIARTPEDPTPYLKFRSWVTDDAGHRLMKLAGQDLDALRVKAATRDFQPVKLGLKGKLNLKSEVKRVAAPNVVGVLEGSDPKLKVSTWSTQLIGTILESVLLTKTGTRSTTARSTMLPALHVFSPLRRRSQDYLLLNGQSARVCSCFQPLKNKGCLELSGIQPIRWFHWPRLRQM
jgi:hypothetical protein